MNPRVKHVIANSDYTLTLTFDNNEVKIFDMKPYLDKGIFKELRDMKKTINLGIIFILTLIFIIFGLYRGESAIQLLPIPKIEFLAPLLFLFFYKILNLLREF